MKVYSWISHCFVLLTFANNDIPSMSLYNYSVFLLFVRSDLRPYILNIFSITIYYLQSLNFLLKMSLWSRGFICFRPLFVETILARWECRFIIKQKFMSPSTKACTQRGLNRGTLGTLLKPLFPIIIIPTNTNCISAKFSLEK